MSEPVKEPTPEEAAAALRAVREGRNRVITSAVGSRWLSITCGVVVFLYCTVNDLFPHTQPWSNIAILVFILAMVLGLNTRIGSAVLRRPVTVSSRSLPLALRWRVLRIALILGVGLAASLTVVLLHVPHGGIYYGALAGIYIIFLGPRFQLWLLRRQDKD